MRDEMGWNVMCVSQDRDFRTIAPFMAHRNPPLAELVTSLAAHQHYSARALYDGDAFFWAITPSAGDFLTLTFLDPPVFLAG